MTNSLSINLKEIGEKIELVEIYDVTGRLIKKQSGEMSSDLLVDVSDISSGGYFVIVNNKYLKKVVKLRSK